MQKVIASTDSNACWGWSACLNDHGYGRIRIKNIEYVASRLAYAVHNGEDPAHLDVLHSCNNPCCTNPRHLKLGSHLENMQYAASMGRLGGRGISRNAGAKNPMAKLSDNEVAEILEMYATGLISQKAIGAKFGVTQGYVSSVITKSRRATVASDKAREIIEKRYDPPLTTGL